MNFWLTDEQFNKIKPLLPNKRRNAPPVEDCRVLSGIIFRLQRGYSCSDVPVECGSAMTLYNRYRRWLGAVFLSESFKRWPVTAPPQAR